MEGWIDIAEFASKYGVSASTLRRRIRSESINFKMYRGKYFLEDTAEALKAAPLFSRRNTTSPGSPRQSVTSTASGNIADPVGDFLASPQVVPVHLREDFERLQGENKKLKAQIAELETLVKVLEGELSAREH